MKKFTVFLLFVSLTLALFGCAEAEIAQTTIPTESTEIPTTAETTLVVTEPINLSGPMTAVSLPAVTETATAEDCTTLFQYTYQNMSLTLSAQATADQVILDFLSRIDATRATAESILSSANAGYTGSANWIPYLCQVTYNPQRIDRGVLSLYGTMITYTGASHPDTSCVSANYDLLTGDVLTLGSILTDESVIDPLCQLVIDHLNEIAEEKYLRSGFEADVKARFSGEASYDEAWYFSQTGLCFYFAPYEIAPYSSGVIVAEVPYGELVDIIMDEFFPAEQQPLSGTLSAMPFTTDDAAQFTQISELILDQDGNMSIIYCDSSVHHVSVLVSDPATELSYVAYAAEYLNPGDAITIAYNDAQSYNIQIEYISNGEICVLDLAQ